MSFESCRVSADGGGTDDADSVGGNGLEKRDMSEAVVDKWAGVDPDGPTSIWSTRGKSGGVEVEANEVSLGSGGTSRRGRLRGDW